MADPNSTDNYSRRVDDLITLVQKTIDDVNRFLRGEMNVPPEKYQQVKNTLVARQREALTAMNNAIAGQQELLKGMQTTGKPIPQRRASDTTESGYPQPRLESVEDEEISELRRRAGIRD